MPVKISIACSLKKKKKKTVDLHAVFGSEVAAAEKGETELSGGRCRGAGSGDRGVWHQLLRSTAQHGAAQTAPSSTDQHGAV